MQSGTAIGAIVTPLIIKQMLTAEAGSWRPVFQWIGGLGAAWVVLWILLVREQDLRPLPPSPRSTNVPQDDSFLAAVLSRRFAVLVFSGIAINVAWHLFRVWLPLFLRNGRGYSEAATLDFNFAYHLATDVGCLAAGFLTTYLCRRGLTAVVSRSVTFTACGIRLTKSPGRKSGDTGSLGFSRVGMARGTVFTPGVPRLPPGLVWDPYKP